MLTRRETGLMPVRTAFDVALDSVFRDVFHGMPSWETTPTRGFPAVNAWEDEKAFHVEAELPGFEEKDVTVTVLGNELRLEGRREEEKTEEKTKTYQRERFRGDISRVLRFPVDLDEGHIEARFKNGLLTVTLPKAAVALPRKIEIKG